MKILSNQGLWDFVGLDMHGCAEGSHKSSITRNTWLPHMVEYFLGGIPQHGSEFSLLS